MNKPINKCQFCIYWTGKSCMVTQNSYYCKKAADEYYQYIRSNNQPAVKSLRPWDKK